MPRNDGDFSVLNHKLDTIMNYIGQKFYTKGLMLMIGLFLQVIGFLMITLERNHLYFIRMIIMLF